MPLKTPTQDANTPTPSAADIEDASMEPAFQGLVALAASLGRSSRAFIAVREDQGLRVLAQVGYLPGELSPAIVQEATQAVLARQSGGTSPQAALSPRVGGAALLRPDGTMVGVLCVPEPAEPGQTPQGDPDWTQLAQVMVQTLSMRRDLLSRTEAACLEHARVLASREARYQAIVEHQTELVSLAKLDGSLQFANPAYLRHFRLGEDELAGRNLFEFVAPEDREAVARQFRRTLEESAILTGLNRQMFADGRVAWLEWINRPYRDADGELLVHSVGRDVTDRHHAEERLALATGANQVGIWELQVRTGELLWNDMMFRIFDVDPASFGGRYEDWRRCVHPDDLDPAEHELQEALAGHRALDFDFRIRLRDGSIRHVHARAQVFRDAQGQPERVLGINFDVTARKNIERELAEKHELLRVTLRSIGDAVITTDAHGAVQWMNPAAENMTGWSSEAAHRLRLTEVFRIVDQTTREPTPCPARTALQGGLEAEQAHPTLLISRLGREYGVEYSAAPIRDAVGSALGVVLVFHDVTEQQRLSSELSYRIRHDDLTGLSNRVEFEERLGQLMHSIKDDDSGRHALLFVDLDQFKLVNDACGHGVGDQLLRRVSALLRETVRAQDMVARLGGDEFAIVLQHCAFEQARGVAQKICDLMDDFHFVHDGRRFRVGASIGLVPLDTRWTDLPALMQAADAACYAAKEAGRNRVHAWVDPQEAAGETRRPASWSQRLQRALNEGSFELWSQQAVALHPQAVDLRRVRLFLRDAGERRIPYESFIAQAERFNLALPIDRWILESVSALLQAGGSRPLGRICIRLSAAALGDRGFHRQLANWLAASPRLGELLGLDLPEWAVSERPGDARHLIDTLRPWGLTVGLADFGAGTSSFGYLRGLAIDNLHVDPQATRDLSRDPLSRATLRCFREIARAIGARMYVQGVDEARDLEILRELGADGAQGLAVDAGTCLQSPPPGSPYAADGGGKLETSRS